MTECCGWVTGYKRHPLTPPSGICRRTELSPKWQPLTPPSGMPVSGPSASWLPSPRLLDNPGCGNEHRCETNAPSKAGQAEPHVPVDQEADAYDHPPRPRPDHVTDTLPVTLRDRALIVQSRDRRRNPCGSKLTHYPALHSVHGESHRNSVSPRGLVGGLPRRPFLLRLLQAITAVTAEKRGRSTTPRTRPDTSSSSGDRRYPIRRSFPTICSRDSNPVTPLDMRAFQAGCDAGAGATGVPIIALSAVTTR